MPNRHIVSVGWDAKWEIRKKAVATPLMNTTSGTEAATERRGGPRKPFNYKYSIDGVMQTYIVEKTDDSVTIAFKDANLTLITPLMDALYKDDSVELVRYIDKHPELEDRRLYVKVKSGSAIEALERASDAISNYYTAKE